MMMLTPRVLSRTGALAASRKLAPALQLQPRVTRASLATKAQQGGGNNNVGIERRGGAGNQRPQMGMARREEPLLSTWPSFRRMSGAMDEMRREMDSMMGAFGFRDPYFSSFPPLTTRDFFDDYAPSFPAEMEDRRPIPVSMDEHEKSYVFHAEVPGLKPQDVKISYDSDNHMLTISGERREEMTKEQGNFRSSVSFTRSFRPPTDCDVQSEDGKASAMVKDGMLRLELPKVDPSKKANIKDIPVM